MKDIRDRILFDRRQPRVSMNLVFFHPVADLLNLAAALITVALLRDSKNIYILSSAQKRPCFSAMLAEA